MVGGRLEYRHSAMNNEVTKFFTYTVIILNIVFVVLGAMMFAMGLYILFESDFRQWISDMEMEFYYTGVYILLAAGVLVMLQSFFGICGAYQKKTCFLITFMTGLFVCFVLEIAGAAYTLNNGITDSNVENWLDTKFRTLIAEYDFNENSKRTMSIVQEWVGCCGADGIQDYIAWNKVIPSTCYDPVNGNAWYKDGYGYVGCTRGFAIYIEGMSGWISGLALTLAFLQIFAFIAALMLACIKTEFKKSRSTLNLNR